MRISKIFWLHCAHSLRPKHVGHALIIGYLHIVLSLWKNELLTIQNNFFTLADIPQRYCLYMGIIAKRMGFYIKNMKLLT